MGKLTKMYWKVCMVDELTSEAFQLTLEQLKAKVVQRGDLPYLSTKQQIHYIQELAKFPLGRVLLEKKSLDAFWTDFIVTHSGGKTHSNLEDFILNRSPTTISWRELLQVFKKIIQINLENQMVLASIPCGAMRELLCLDYSCISNFQLIGIDIDLNSLSLAKHLAEKYGISKHLSLRKQDAWHLPYDGDIDLIASCGLNIYISDQQKVVELYRQFFKSLKVGGKLVVGFLTYPPGEGGNSEWKLDKISPDDLCLEKAIYKDILELQCRNFRSSEELEKELTGVGFSEVTFYYDTLHVYPAVVAKK